MTDSKLEYPSATVNSTENGISESNQPRICEAFNKVSGTVVFKSSDNVIFRVEDFYLKAMSGLFRDMLQDSVASSSIDRPLPLDETSHDLEIMFSIMTGRQQEVLDRAKDWEQAARLYRLVDKYQLDGLRPWFAQICCAHAMDEPWEALFLACNQSPMETRIIKIAISQGFEKQGRNKLCLATYFKTITRCEDRSVSWDTINSANITLLFGLRLGHRGVLAYNATFHDVLGIDPKEKRPTSWKEDGDKFVQHALAVDRTFAGFAS